MITRLLALAFVLLAGPLAAQETVCLNWGSSYDLPAGKMMTFNYCGHHVDLQSSYGEIRVLGTIQGEVLVFSGRPEQLMPTERFGGKNDNIPGCPCANMVICGPATVNITSTSPATAVSFFHVIATVENQVKTAAVTADTIPMCTVVIPEDATGPVEIKLESSIDMVSWNAANPGTYGTSTAKRFFRVRAVQQ